MSNEHEEVEYGLVMPFVVCASKGGPYQDDAYVAGWEAAKLDSALAFADSLGVYFVTPATFDLPFHAGNAAQVDLIAMRHGYAATLQPAADGWVTLTLDKDGSW